MSITLQDLEALKPGGAIIIGETRHTLGNLTYHVNDAGMIIRAKAYLVSGSRWADLITEPWPPPEL